VNEELGVPYIRISLMVPRSGRVNEAGRLLDAVALHCEGQPGFIRGYRLEPSDGSGLIGRVTIWADERSADAVARSERMLALRSTLNDVVRKNSHQERGFWAYDTSDPAESSGPTAGAELVLEDVMQSVERIFGAA
jgi:hypothetical protein